MNTLKTSIRIARYAMMLFAIAHPAATGADGVAPTWAYCVGSTYNNSVPQSEYLSEPFPMSGSEDIEAEAFKACVQRLYPEVNQLEFYAGCRNTRSSYQDASGAIALRINRTQSATGRPGIQTTCSPG
jgi:hypothetical protein